MNPDNRSPGGALPSQDRTVTPPPQQDTQQEAAANVIRTQISALYDSPASVDPVAQAAAQPAAAQQHQHDTNPYHRTHTAHTEPTADQWKEYHSAWQNYYQKYYEGYYTQQQIQQQHVLSQQQETVVAPTPERQGFFSSHIEPEETISTEPITKDQALFELRQKLLGRIKKSARKVRKSRHFVPIAASLVVVLIFVFIQYNRVFIASVQAYVAPGNGNVQNIVIDPTGEALISADPRLIIPKINVDVPAIYGIGNDHNSQMSAMEKGVAHFAIPGASSHPGEIGNTVLSGHSSNDLFDGGDYKFIFAQLDKLAIGDSIYANYEGKRYTYVITKKEVVAPNEVNKLVYPTDKPMLTLITCTPLGTALNRLLVTAEQVSPDPAKAAAAPSEASAEESAMPGNSPTFLQRLFGAR